jgi:hypothetical protein
MEDMQSDAFARATMRFVPSAIVLLSLSNFAVFQKQQAHPAMDGRAQQAETYRSADVDRQLGSPYEVF